MDRFFGYIEKESASKQSFSKARANLNPEYVPKFADGIAEIHAQDPDALTYCISDVGPLKQPLTS